MDLKELKQKYDQALKAAKAALEAGNAEEAKERNDEAAGLKALIQEHERLAAAEAEKEAAEKEAKAKAEAEAAERREKEIQDLATQKAREMLANVGLDRPEYGANGGAPASSDEGPTLRMYGPYDQFSASELAFGYMVLKAHAQKGYCQPPTQDFFRAVHGRAVDHVQKRGLKPLYEPAEDSRSHKRLGRAAQPVVFHQKSDARVMKALSVKADELMGSDVDDAGDEWIPVFYSREVFRLVRNEAMVAGLFRQLEIEGETYTFPIQTGGVTWYRTPQTDDAAEMVYSNAFITSRISQVGTESLTLTPKKLSAIVIWTGEMNQQTLVPMLPFLQQEFIESGAHTLDELLISGHTETGATNISDYANGAISTYWRLLTFNGLRYHALVDGSGANARDGGGITAEDFLDTKKLMGTNGKYALQPSKVAWIPDLLVYYQMQALGELLTRDKHIPATIEDGEVTKVFGSPVVPSEDYGATNSSGYIHNTTSGNTLGSMLCVRPDQGAIGFSRRMMMETGRIRRADAYEIVGHMEADFDLTSYDFCAISYNLTV